MTTQILGASCHQLREVVSTLVTPGINNGQRRALDPQIFAAQSGDLSAEVKEHDQAGHGSLPAAALLSSLLCTLWNLRGLAVLVQR